MNFLDFSDWLLKGVLAGCAIYGVNVLAKMKQSIEDLNRQVAVILETKEWHQKILQQHDERIRLLEIKR